MADSPRDDDVAQAYDRWAATYDTAANATRDLDAAIVRRHGPDPTDCDVLELGCGTGKNTVWLAERARRVVAIDFSQGMLHVARRRVTTDNVQFVRQDVRARWPLRDVSFDVVIGNLILEHVDDVNGVFAEAARVLRPSGVLFICELHPFRQLRGGQAHFTDASGETVYVSAFVHSVAEYVNGAIDAGLAIAHAGEWFDERDTSGTPRLFSLTSSR